MELHSARYITSYKYNLGMQMIPADQQHQHFGCFAMSNNIPLPTNVQTTIMAQHEQIKMHQQQQQMAMPMLVMEAHQGLNMEPYNPYAAFRVGGYLNQ